jgi:hypothetical protein
MLSPLDRAQEVQRQFAAADLIVLLLSADFFASPDCLAIMEQALERSRTDNVRVTPTHNMVALP